MGFVVGWFLRFLCRKGSGGGGISLPGERGSGGL